MGKKRKKQKKPVAILAPDHDFYRTFGAGASPEPVDEKETVPEAEPEPDFSTLLEESLKGKSISRLLREKKDKKKRIPLSLQQRIRRYPGPECELDLHGFQAFGARIQADTYIRAKKAQGFFTLRIIVGRGKHSEIRAILPDVVEDLLADLKKEQLVLHFEWEKKSKSKSGAVIVYLKQFCD